jgi:hypothetical protein
MEQWQQGLGQGTPAKGPMEDDKKNRAKAAQLNLIDFEKEEYRKKLQASKGWTDAEYDDFLKKYKDYVESLKNEAAASDKPAVAPMPGESGKPFTSLEGGKVDPTTPGTGTTTNNGTTSAPPGFEKARGKFQEALDALKKKP